MPPTTPGVASERRALLGTNRAAAALARLGPFLLTLLLSPTTISQAATPLEPSTDALNSARRMAVAPGLQLEVLASEPFFANPVSFSFDPNGDVYVVETYRRRTSVFDIRNHPDWLDADFSLRSVADREQFLRAQVQPENRTFQQSAARRGSAGGFQDFNRDGRVDALDLQVESEQIRLLQDTDGDGRPDRATVYATGFNSIVSGVAAGVLAHRGEVWFTCIPDLWKLRDTNGDGQADVRLQLHHGFGVHIAFGGHDLHGLRFGPDGRLYFSIADRGTHVEKAGATRIHLPDSGAVFRCDPDGSRLELYARGLRNPQELVFDDHGNLWTGDNNSDGGDKARWVQVLEGSDSGWTLGWQWLPGRGAWNEERLWHTAPDNTAPHLLPPIAYIGHGPAGIAYYPGTGLPDRFANHFFMADFPGGIRTFTLSPQGASFRVNEDPVALQDNSPAQLTAKSLWNLSPVDVDFGPHGGLYVLDWVEGWEKTGKGRILRLADPDTLRSPAVAEVREFLRLGPAGVPSDPLARRLAHRDQRVRLDAQFELARRGAEGALHLAAAAQSTGTTLERIHGIWGLGQILEHQANTRNGADLERVLVSLLADPDPEVRAQAAKELGERRVQRGHSPLLDRLADTHPRVQLFAAQSLGKLGVTAAVPPLLDILHIALEKDRALQHVVTLAIARLARTQDVLPLLQSNNRQHRLAAVLLLRHWERPELSRALLDPDLTVAAEAARAIHDLPIPAALPQLAAALDRPPQLHESATETEQILHRAWLRRALNANFRLGNSDSTRRLARFAANPQSSESLRLQALEALEDWNRPPNRDRVVGLWRPFPAAGRASPWNAFLSQWPNLFQPTLGPTSLVAAVRTAVAIMPNAALPKLEPLLDDTNAPLPVRQQILRGLYTRHDEPNRLRLQQKIARAADPRLTETLQQLDQTSLRSLPIEIVQRRFPVAPAPEQARILAELRRRAEPSSTAVLRTFVDQAAAGQFPAELLIDLAEAATQHPDSTLKAAWETYQARLTSLDGLERRPDLRAGGDPALGRTVFLERADLGCLRCHKVGAEGGDVGPNLTRIGAQRTRDQILLSILEPNREISPGFESATLILTNQSSVFGVVKTVTDTHIELDSPEDGRLRIPKNEIARQEKALSPMPPDISTLITPRDLRNLAAYLESLR